MNAANRIRKGFLRLGLVISVPLVLSALAAGVYAVTYPNGPLVANEPVLESLPTLKPFEIRPVQYGDRDSVNSLLFGQDGFDFEMDDGRQMRAYPKAHNTPFEVAELKQDIVAFEVHQQSPIGGFDRFSINHMFIGCAAFQDCSYPFPNTSSSHLRRSADWTLSLILLATAAIWMVLTQAISWLIRGFMVE